jgi:hypothetical protein
VIEVIERHVDVAHGDAVRSTSDPDRALSHFERRAQPPRTIARYVFV